MRAWLMGLLGILTSAAIALSLIYRHKAVPPSQSSIESVVKTSNIEAQNGTPSPFPSSTVSGVPAQVGDASVNNPNPDLTVNASGLSKAVVVMTTNKGVIKFRFYSNEAPKTTHRLIELIHLGFYKGLTFHRVEPGFVVQGGDPNGNGTGGSGQKLEAEFNQRRHVEGTVAMARASEPNSADSQFYISLGTHPRLDRNYTVFGQVVEGMEFVRKIQVGDKMLSVIVQ